MSAPLDTSASSSTPASASASMPRAVDTSTRAARASRTAPGSPAVRYTASVSLSSSHGQRVVGARAEPVADHGDRALAGAVHVDEGAPLRLGPEGRLHPQAVRLELALGAVAELVVAERRVERRLAGELRELHRGHGSAAAGLLPDLARVDDVPGARHRGHGGELDPLHVPNHGRAHGGAV